MRYITRFIKQTLPKRAVFIGGPRQVGKTTLALSLIGPKANAKHPADMLPDRVGSPLSIQSLAEDIQVDHKTIKRWVSVLQVMYFCYRIPPFGAKKIRAVKKEQKLYLWDWSVISDVGARWENLVGSQLLKFCHWVEDTQGEIMELRYLRDVDKREVDFVALKN